MPHSTEDSTAPSIEEMKEVSRQSSHDIEDAFESSPLDEMPTSFELVLKVYDGFTSILAKAIKESNVGTGNEQGSTHVQKVKLLVEGPYGGSVRLQSYSTVLLVSGGSGISATISHLADLAKKRGNLQRIVVVWSIRDPSKALNDASQIAY